MFNYKKLFIIFPIFFMTLQMITLILSRYVYSYLSNKICSDCKFNKTSEYLKYSSIPILLLVIINLTQVIYKFIYGFKGIYAKLSTLIIILSVLFSITYNIILYNNIKSINDSNCSCIQYIKKEYQFLKKYR